MLLSEPNTPDRQHDRVSFALRVFVISFLVVYFGFLFIGPECADAVQEISTGEPPF